MLYRKKCNELPNFHRRNFAIALAKSASDELQNSVANSFQDGQRVQLQAKFRLLDTVANYVVVQARRHKRRIARNRVLRRRKWSRMGTEWRRRQLRGSSRRKRGCRHLQPRNPRIAAPARLLSDSSERRDAFRPSGLRVRLQRRRHVASAATSNQPAVARRKGRRKSGDKRSLSGVLERSSPASTSRRGRERRVRREPRGRRTGLSEIRASRRSQVEDSGRPEKKSIPTRHPGKLQKGGAAPYGGCRFPFSAAHGGANDNSLA